MATYIRKYFNEHPRLTDFAHTYERRIVVSIAVFYIVAHAVVIPMILNKKSDKPLAENIQKEFGNTPLYGYISTDMLRFFGTNFYLGDRIGQFEVSKPDHGILMIAKGDCEEFMKKHEKTYKFYFASQTNRRMTEMRDTIQFYKFKRLSTK